MSDNNNNRNAGHHSHRSFWNIFHRGSRRRDAPSGQPDTTSTPDVEMNAAPNAGEASSSSGSASMSRRRARSEDDEDGGERDHRHPSARGTPIPERTPSSSRSTPGAPTNPPSNPNPTLVDFATGLFAGTPLHHHIHRRPARARQPQPQQHGQPQPTPLGSGYVRAQDVPNLLNMVRQMVSTATINLNMDSRDNTDDPERAKKLVNALEEVPLGLLLRLEHASGNDGSEGNCAICWERLLDSDGWKATDAESSSDVHQDAVMDPPSSSDANANAEEEPMKPKIVTMPCAHIFHSACLLPWFTRPGHTTCPSCRFDLDPDSLTYNAATLRHRPPPPQQQQGDEHGEGDGIEETEQPEDAGDNVPTNAWHHTFQDAMLSAAGRQQPSPSLDANNNTSQLPSFADILDGTYDPFALPGDAPRAPNPPLPTPPSAANATASPFPALRQSPPATGDAPPPPPPPPRTANPFPLPMSGMAHQGGLLGEHIGMGEGQQNPRGTTMRIESDGHGNTVMTFGFDVIVDEHFMPPMPGPLPPQGGDEEGNMNMPFNMRIGAGATMQEAMGSLLAGMQGGGAAGFGGGGGFNAAPAANDPGQTHAATDGNGAAPAASPPPQTPQNPGLNASGLFTRVIENAILNALRNTPAAGGAARGPDIATPPPPPLPRERRVWVLPSPPGLSLRQRVEKMERTKGWRCYDPSCGLGPTDEEPESNTVSPQSGICKSGNGECAVCEHTFHPACLVSAERVRCVLNNQEVPSVGAKEDAAGGVTVSCIVCRQEGAVPCQVWKDGAEALA